MGRLGDSIAILEGFEESSMSVAPDDADGRIGQVRAGINQGNVLFKNDMIQASGGANYAGGSNFFPGAPLMPGMIGLADYDVSPDDADGRIGQVRAGLGAVPVMGPFAQRVTRPLPGVQVKTNVINDSGGANRSGGSSFFPGAPLLTSSVGLAGDYGRAGLGGGYGRAGLGGGYGRAGLGACAACTGSAVDADLASAFEAYDSSPDDADGRIGQVRAGINQGNVLFKQDMIQASGGANYAGGSNFFPGAPLMPGMIGLAGPEGNLFDAINARGGQIPNVLPERVNVVDPSSGANYTGGSSFTGGMPLVVSSAGLAELRSPDALDRKDLPRFKLAADARALFERIAGRAVIKGLHARVKLARQQANAAAIATLGRQLAIARRIRRAVFSTVQAGTRPTAAQISQLAATIAQQVAAAPLVNTTA